MMARKERTLPPGQRELLALVRRLELGSEAGVVELAELAAEPHASKYGRDQRARKIDALVFRGVVELHGDRVCTTPKGRAELGDETECDDEPSLAQPVCTSASCTDSRTCSSCKSRRAALRAMFRGAA